MALKRILLACVLALPTFLLNGQSAYTPDSSLLPLAHKITDNISNDSDKVVAIYQWMSKNLTYDYDSDAHGATKNEEWQRPAMVVQRKKGVCDGYARLFQDLCQLNDIYAAYIVGYTSFNDLTDSAQTLHAWNSVRVNARWYLMDITWEDAGFDYVKDPKKPKRLSPREHLAMRLVKTQNRRIVDKFNTGYQDVEKVALGNFLTYVDSTKNKVIEPQTVLNQPIIFTEPATSYLFTPPHVFRRDHLPKDPLWQLTDSVVSIQKFFFQRDPSVSPYFSTHFDYKKRLEELPTLDSTEHQRRELSRSLQFNPRDWIVIQNVAFDYNSRIHQAFQTFNNQSNTASVVELEQLLSEASQNLIQAEGFHRLAGSISTGYANENMIENLAVCIGYRFHIEQLREWLKTNR